MYKLDRPSLRFASLAAAAVGALFMASGSAPATAGQAGYEWNYGFGTPASESDVAAFLGLSAQPDGHGLPPGAGSYEQGKAVYASTCVACHGEKLEGLPPPGAGGDKLIGGRGSLASDSPVKTIESYWPYASTLFDYVKRAMPFNAPGSLTNDQVYALVAYILGEAGIVSKTASMDAKTLPKVEMPNSKGFGPDPRPEIELYR